MQDRFLIGKIFKGNELAYGVFKPSNEKDVRGKEQGGQGWGHTEQLSTDIKVWQAHLEGTQSIGTVPVNHKGECHWGCIDIDTYKNFNHTNLLKSIERAKLPLTVCRSKSGGAHVYCFFKNAVKATDLQKKLKQARALLGYKDAEIFPKQNKLLRGQTGNYVNAPYFNEKNCQRYALKLDNGKLKILSLEEFYNEYEEKALTKIDDLNVQTDIIFPKGPPCNNCIALNGCSEGGRNNFLFNCAVMLKRMHEESKEDWLMELREINQNHVDTPLDEVELSRIYASVTGHMEHQNRQVLDNSVELEEADNSNYHYLCKQEPMSSFCDRVTCMSRKFGVQRNMEEGDGYPEIASIDKVYDEPIFYYVTFGGGVSARMESDDLFEEKNWRKKVGLILDAKPPALGAANFDDWMRVQMRERMTHVQLPEGVGRFDRIKESINEWFLGTGQGENRESLLQGSSWHDTDKKIVYFVFSDLYSALISTKAIKENAKDSSMLMDFLKRPLVDEEGNAHPNPGLGAVSKRININNKTKAVWAIKEENLNLEEEEIEPKEIIKEEPL